MNYISTHTYDEQTVRWLLPDPAEQFSNPYLAMGNNPVMYVDPDGEFILTALALIAAPFTAGASLTLLPYTIGADIGAYAGGAMANDHMNPLKWDFNSADTWIGMGAGAAIGAAGGHGFLAKKGAIQGMSTTAGKKLFGGIIGGTTNAISNYGGADDFGWGTLADFGSGFAGSYAGINFESKFMGFMVGGTANTMSQGFQNIGNDDFTGYNLAQSFVGGGLSSMVGMSYGMPKGPAPIGQKATFKSFSKSFVKYSGQSAMWDFAYTSQDDFAKRNFGDFATLYGVGGALGASVDMLKFMTPLDGSRRSQVMANKLFKGTLNAAIAVTELRMTSQLKGKAGKPKEQPTKLGVLSTKWWFNFTGF